MKCRRAASQPGSWPFRPRNVRMGPAMRAFPSQGAAEGGPAGAGVDLDQSPNTITVDVTAVNDEPTLIATGNSTTFTEGGAAADLFSSVTASTVEAGQSITSLTLTVTNVTNGANEILSFDGS